MYIVFNAPLHFVMLIISSCMERGKYKSGIQLGPACKLLATCCMKSRDLPGFGISPSWRSLLRCGRRRVEARTAWYGQTAGGSPGVSPRGQSCRSRTWWSRYRQGIVRGCCVSAGRLESDKLGTYWFFLHLQIFARFITPHPVEVVIRNSTNGWTLSWP